MAAEKEIKTMKLYSDVERIYKQLEQLGYSKTDALKVEDVNKFDEYHYLGTDAVLHCIKELGINSSHKVLDFGSGLGGPARYIVANTNCELLAVDLQADLNETALDLTKRCGLGGKLKHICGDMLKLDMKPASFDFLVNWLVILHIEDRKTLFDNCFRLLKPGGKIYTEDYFKLSEYDEDFGKMLKRDLYIPYLPTREEYIQQMEQAGFSDIQVLCEFGFSKKIIPIKSLTIKCEGRNCSVKWFHLRCIGLTFFPPCIWFCPDCLPADVEKYCICRQEEYGLMLGCDNKDCEITWYHLPCIQGSDPEPPVGEWYCPQCAKRKFVEEV